MEIKLYVRKFLILKMLIFQMKIKKLSKIYPYMTSIIKKLNIIPNIFYNGMVLMKKKLLTSTINKVIVMWLLFILK